MSRAAFTNRTGMSDNPISKRPHWVARFPNGKPGLYLGGPGRWIGTCPACGETTAGAYSRKVAKDQLHRHEKSNHEI